MPFKTQLGNHLIALTNAIHYAEKTDSTIYIPKDSLLPGLCDTIVPFHPDVDKTIIHDTFHGEGIYYYASILLTEQERRDVLHRHVIAHLPRPTECLSDRHLVIHVRSGDLYTRHYHPAYQQPPLVFYTHIIEEGDYEEITIVTQPDRLNPVIARMLELYPGRITVRSEEEASDVQFILSARHLVMSIGSFSYMMSLCSQCLERLYCFEAQKNIYYPTAPYEIIVIGLEDYTTYPRDWRDENVAMQVFSGWKTRRVDMSEALDIPKSFWENGRPDLYAIT
jgi:hypothetical protein